MKIQLYLKIKDKKRTTKFKIYNSTVAESGYVRLKVNSWNIF